MGELLSLKIETALLNHLQSIAVSSKDSSSEIITKSNLPFDDLYYGAVATKVWKHRRPVSSIQMIFCPSTFEGKGNLSPEICICEAYYL